MRISIDCSIVGSSTMTGWKRRSRAASRSMYLRYSSRVVAPMHCSSPRARGGLRMFAASIAPSAAPAPTRVCSSSMKRTASLVLRNSSMIFLSRSSNSPRYLVPATSEPMSSVRTRLLRSVSGTSPLTIRWARPSAIAVLPTPGSPIRAGWFLVRRGGGRRRLREGADDLVANLVQAHSERLEHSGGYPFAFPDQPEEQVLRAYVVVAEPAGLVDGQLDDSLGAWGQSHLADDRAIAPSDDELDGCPNLGQLDVHVLENARGHALALPDEAKEQMLGSDVVVVEPLRLVLSQRQDLARAIRELVETIHLPERLFSIDRQWRPYRHASTPCDPCISAGLWGAKNPRGGPRVLRARALNRTTRQRARAGCRSKRLIGCTGRRSARISLSGYSAAGVSPSAAASAAASGVDSTDSTGASSAALATLATLARDFAGAFASAGASTSGASAGAAWATGASSGTSASASAGAASARAASGGAASGPAG